MLGILLLLLNNHKKFVDTVKNVKYTTKSIGRAKKDGDKYFYDINGNRYDAETGTALYNGRDKYTGHRGMIDANTGMAFEDHIEQSVAMVTEQYYNGKFQSIKERLDARKKCLVNGIKVGDKLSYNAGNNQYSIYWDKETKHFVEVATDRRPCSPAQIKKWVDKGYPKDLIYEYYCWKGESVKYPLDIGEQFSKSMW